MKRLFLTLLILLGCLSAQAYVITTVTVQFTNTIWGTSNYNTLTCNADTRTWTNQVYAPATQILTNATQSGSAGNLLNHLSLYPFSGVGLSQSATTNVIFISGKDVALNVSVSAGWATLVTNTYTYGLSNISVVVPDSYVASEKTNVYSGVAEMVNSVQNTNKFLLLQVTASPTNWIIDASSTPLQRITATNDVNIQFITNGPGHVWLEILPNGADRLLTVPTNWVIMNTNAWRRSGQYWASTVTNNATTGTGPRRFLLKMLLDDSASSQTNVVAEGAMSPSPSPAAGSGTVTSVDIAVPAEFSISGDPITTSGTMTIGKANETANTVWAGPTSGGAAAPTFRALVTADIPTLGTAGTYRSTTFDASGRETSGSNPTTFSGYGLSDSSANFFASLTDDNGSSWTNLNYFLNTNSINSGVFTTGTDGYETNISGNITLGSFAGVPANKAWSIYIWATNSSGSDHTITFPNGTKEAGAAPAVFTVTNKLGAEFQVTGWGNKKTNVNWIPHY